MNLQYSVASPGEWNLVLIKDFYTVRYIDKAKGWLCLRTTLFPSHNYKQADTELSGSSSSNTNYSLAYSYMALAHQNDFYICPDKKKNTLYLSPKAPIILRANLREIRLSRHINENQRIYYKARLGKCVWMYFMTWSRVIRIVVQCLRPEVIAV